MAEALGHTITVVPRLPGGAIGGLNPFTCGILVLEGLYGPRMQATIAHELGEHYTPRRIDPAWHEAFCDRAAAALMMPREAFLETGSACGWDLETLRAWWPHCSCLALVRRAAELLPNAAASAWEGGAAILRRVHAQANTPAWVDDLEAFAACEAFTGSGASEAEAGGVRVQAWRTGKQYALTLVRPASTA